MEQNLNNFCEFVRGLLAGVNYTLEMEDGRKYIRLVMVTTHGNRSCWGFVNKETGDILKAATWKAPAKHARGNIANPESYADYPWTGPHYLR